MISNCHQHNRKLLSGFLKTFNKTYRRYLHEEGVRVRFAPSPTGYLHIGGLRTALYNYLFARQHKNGKFIVRIEDTDQSRLVPSANKRLIKTLEWAGIGPDESPNVGGDYGPYTQSERIHYYKKYAEKLVAERKAYPCFCSQRRLGLLKMQQTRNNEVQRYDNRCRHLSESEVREKMLARTPYVIRLALRAEQMTYKDELVGDMSINLNDYEGDPVLLKSDGFATYHLANVVDDHLMRITHVIRGKEWMNSLPKHFHLYRSLGWQPPQFYHVPLLMNMDGKKLSKRHGDVFVEEYIKRGYTPSALLNFVASCSGGFPQDTFPVKLHDHRELLEHLVEKFNLPKLSQNDGKINFEKLDEFSFELTRTVLTSDDSKLKYEIVAQLKEMIKHNFEESYIFTEFSDEESDFHLRAILKTLKDRVVKLNDLVSQDFAFLWCRPTDYELNYSKELTNFLKEFITFLNNTDWEVEFDANARKLIRQHSSKKLPLWKVMRLMLAGVENGVPVIDLVKILGKRETLRRLESVYDDLKKMERTRA